MAFRPIRGYADCNRYPSTEHQLRHIFRERGNNGLADAFRRLGVRVLFDPERLQELLAASPEVTSQRTTAHRLGKRSARAGASA